MPGDVTCPNCHRRLRLPDGFTGTRVRCICGSVIDSPGVDSGCDATNTASSSGTDLQLSQDALNRMQTLLDEEMPHHRGTTPIKSAHPGTAASEMSRGEAKPNVRAHVGRRNSQATDGSDDRARYPVQEYPDAAEAKFREREAEKLGPTRFPMVVGVFDFPWRLSTLASLLPMSVMLTIAAGMQVFFFTYGVQAGLVGVRTIGVAAFLATVMALCYATACCVTVIQETANGTVSIEEWPAVLNWKEWGGGRCLLGPCCSSQPRSLYCLPFGWENGLGFRPYFSRLRSSPWCI